MADFDASLPDQIQSGRSDNGVFTNQQGGAGRNVTDICFGDYVSDRLVYDRGLGRRRFARRPAALDAPQATMHRFANHRADILSIMVDHGRLRSPLDSDSYPAAPRGPQPIGLVVKK